MMKKHKPYTRNVKIKCNETGIVFDNITEASEMIGCGKSALCNHLAGRFPHVRGLTFTRLLNEEEA